MNIRGKINENREGGNILIKILDSTLAMLDEYFPSKDKILKFCSYMNEIGIKDLELSKQVYETIEELPSGFRFYLRIEPFENRADYHGIYRYIENHGKNESKVISEFQINDIKELIHLRNHGDLSHVRVIGLDDIFCHDYLYTFREINKIFRKGEVNFCPEDAYYCATGMAVEWLLNGGKEVTTAFAGSGSRAATEEVYVAMNVVKRYKPNQSLEILVKTKELFEDIIHEKVPDFKPIIGEKIFQVESGIHVDGILKNPANYEAYPPEKVGQKTEFVIGKYSGSNSILMKCEELGLDHLDSNQVSILLEHIKMRSVEKRNSISNSEFIELYKEVVENETKY